MIRGPCASLLKVTSRSVYRDVRAPSFYRSSLTRASSTSNSSSPEPPIENDVSKTPPNDAPAVAEIIQSKPYIPLYHHKDPSLFPQLIPGSLPYIIHNLSSAFNATVTLFSSQEARDKFIAIANLREENIESDNLYGSIINSNVVAQSDMGFVKVLALFDELNSPLFKDTQFNVTDFMDGASYAIERFHEVGREHMNMMTTKMEAAGEEKMKYDFLETAHSDPESLEHDLMEMTTPIYWKGFQETLNALVEAPTFLLDMLKQGPPPSSRITHLALLSARAVSIEKPVTVSENSGDDDPNAPLEDDTLKPHIERGDSQPQIVTQLEVLYESEVTLPETDDGDSKRTDVVRTKRVVDVATFEACLAGDPNGDLRWRLCYTRPALEFGYGAGPMLHTKQ